MCIELGSNNPRLGALKLGPNQTVKVVDGVGSTVCAVEGSVWITADNQNRDVVLERGACYRLRKGGPALITVLDGEAAVSFGLKEPP